MDRLDPLLVFVGGAVGAVGRYGVGLLVGPAPVGTLAVNVAGAFALGTLVTRAPRPRAQVFLGTGLLSSFTTYSAFAVETVGLAPRWAAGYVAATYVLGLAAAVAGRRFGGRLA